MDEGVEGCVVDLKAKMQRLNLTPTPMSFQILGRPYRLFTP